MSNKRDYYEVLGVNRGASKDEIKKSYRNLARQYHPDVSREEDAEDKFKEINEAYEILSDPERKSTYDRFGHAGLSSSGSGFSGFGFGRDPFEIFEEVFGSFAFGGSRRARKGPRRGADLRYDLTMEFEEAVFGKEKEIEISRHETCSKCNGEAVEPGTKPIRCPDCNGTGEVRRQSGFFVSIITCSRCGGNGQIITSPCKECSGRGKTVQSKKLNVKIPAGVDDGTQIRLGGEGEGGTRGGPPGNLYVVVHVRPHSYFRRVGDTIHLELMINIAQASLGDEIEVPTLYGPEKRTISTGTQTGDTITLRGMGVPRLRRDGTTAGRGDQVVTIQVHTPMNLSKTQRDLMVEFGKTLDKEVIPQREKSFFDKVKDVLGV
ncbi:MAG: molecular chaperone DnaJ [Anaerolineaceae bacterium 4572_78]|nr:MAG: molecular chaperone DnaJ [Anaerolineaceae bacterium 4572_78]